MSQYYPDYVPANESHFRDMLDQFRKAKVRGGNDEIGKMSVLWMLDGSVARQDILVAIGRAEREESVHA